MYRENFNGLFVLLHSALFLEVPQSIRRQNLSTAPKSVPQALATQIITDFGPKQIILFLRLVLLKAHPQGGHAIAFIATSSLWDNWEGVVIVHALDGPLLGVIIKVHLAQDGLISHIVDALVGQA